MLSLPYISPSGIPFRCMLDIFMLSYICFTLCSLFYISVSLDCIPDNFFKVVFLFIFTNFYSYSFKIILGELLISLGLYAQEFFKSFREVFQSPEKTTKLD